MILCPRCEKAMTAGHRCVSRRSFFFGLMRGVAAAALAPSIVEASGWQGWIPDNILRPGDMIVSTGPCWGVFSYDDEPELEHRHIFNPPSIGRRMRGWNELMVDDPMKIKAGEGNLVVRAKWNKVAGRRDIFVSPRRDR